VIAGGKDAGISATRCRERELYGIEPAPGDVGMVLDEARAIQRTHRLL